MPWDTRLDRMLHTWSVEWIFALAQVVSDVRRTLSLTSVCHRLLSKAQGL